MMSRDKPDTRRRILNSTRALLEADAGAIVRMADIAKHAGVSRQAVYLHFPTRSELLIATARYLDEIHDIDSALAPSRAAPGGIERLCAFIDAWASHIPRIHGVARALLAMKDSDAAAAAAWKDRMQAVRLGCDAAVGALEADGTLSEEYTREQATDILSTLLSVRNWEQLTQDLGWNQERYSETMKNLAGKILLTDRTGSA